MPDINWGGDSSTAPFSSYLDEANGDLILAKDNSGGTVLLECDGTTWQYRGPVEMNGEDISGVGTLTATDVTVSGTVDAGAVNAGNARITTVSAINNAEPVDERIKIAKRTNINGTEIWSFSDFSGTVRSSPTVVDGVVYVGSDDNTLRAIDAVERFARLYVADSVGWIPLYRGPNEQPQVAGSTLTGNYSTQRETNQ